MTKAPLVAGPDQLEDAAVRQQPVIDRIPSVIVAAGNQTSTSKSFQKLVHDRSLRINGSARGSRGRGPWRPGALSASRRSRDDGVARWEGLGADDDHPRGL